MYMTSTQKSMLIYMNASHNLCTKISPNCKISAHNHKIIKKIDTLLAEIAMLLFLCFAAADRPLLSRVGRTCFTDVLDTVLRWCCTLDPGAWGGRPWRRPGSWLFPSTRRRKALDPWCWCPPRKTGKGWWCEAWLEAPAEVGSGEKMRSICWALAATSVRGNFRRESRWYSHIRNDAILDINHLFWDKDINHLDTYMYGMGLWVLWLWVQGKCQEEKVE